MDAGEGVVIPDEGLFQDKVARLKAGGASSVHVVADFDMTLTAGQSNEPGVRNSSWGAFESSAFRSPSFIAAYKALYKMYSPAIHDGSHNLVERDRLLHEWYGKTLELVMRNRISRQDIARAALSGVVAPRPGLGEFFDAAQRKEIPVVIFSAGLGDFIVPFLEHHKISLDGVQIVSNFYQFDQNGMITGQLNSTVHSLNKNESHADYGVHTIALGRPNVLLLGDFLADIHMADGERHETILSVGFLNAEEEHLGSFKRTFDAVVLSDVGLDLPTSILGAI
jgi:HAD superfamily hydrolase (TIGR01544 family)